jgi:hypothetical protein
MPTFRRKDCIHTAFGIFALCKRLHSTLVESGLLTQDTNLEFKMSSRTNDNNVTNILSLNKELCIKVG